MTDVIMGLPSAVITPERIKLGLLPTPLQPLSRLSKQLGGPRIWLKRDDLTGCALSGNKVRKLEYIFAHALAQGCDAVITCGGLQSNHCRATALLAAQLGLKCTLIVRGDKPAELQGNTLLDALSGADIRYTPPARYQRELEELFEDAADDIRNQGGQPWLIPTGASDGIGIWGYLRGAFELAADFTAAGIEPSAIVHATGSGGTQAGLTLGAHLAQLSSPVLAINVCDDKPYFMSKVINDCRDWQQRYDPTRAVDIAALKPDVIEGYVGAGYAKAGPAVFSAIEQLAKLEGVVMDPVYSGKAFSGFLNEIEQGRFSRDEDVVFVHTGGIFGLYAYGDQLNAHLRYWGQG